MRTSSSASERSSVSSSTDASSKSSVPADLYICVDVSRPLESAETQAGGTKTAAVVANGDGVIVGSARGGSANMAELGLDEAARA